MYIKSMLIDQRENSNKSQINLVKLLNQGFSACNKYKGYLLDQILNPDIRSKKQHLFIHTNQSQIFENHPGFVNPNGQSII